MENEAVVDLPKTSDRPKYEQFSLDSANHHQRWQQNVVLKQERGGAWESRHTCCRLAGRYRQQPGNLIAYVCHCDDDYVKERKIVTSRKLHYQDLYVSFLC
jgi:hypothetical protein